MFFRMTFCIENFIVKRKFVRYNNFIMKDIKNVLLCGLGAVGSVYADKFQRYCPDNFRVLVDDERLTRYTKNQILFNGKPLDCRYVTPNETDFKADLIIVATKITGLGAALNEMVNFVHDDTIIIPLLNGVTSERIVAEKYGWSRVLYGYFIGHSAIREDNNITQDGVNTLVFGAEIKNDERVERVKVFFDNAGVNYKIPDDVRYSLWCKYMLNVSANPTTALLRMTFGEMIANKPFMELAVKIMKEVQMAAKADGINNTESMIDETVAHLKTMLPDGKTSMLQDVEAGRLTEIDIFVNPVIELGQKYGFSTPYCEFLKEMFAIIHENIKNKQ